MVSFVSYCWSWSSPQQGRSKVSEGCCFSPLHSPSWPTHHFIRYAKTLKKGWKTSAVFTQEDICSRGQYTRRWSSWAVIRNTLGTSLIIFPMLENAYDHLITLLKEAHNLTTIWIRPDGRTDAGASNRCLSPRWGRLVLKLDPAAKVAWMCQKVLLTALSYSRPHLSQQFILQTVRKPRTSGWLKHELQDDTEENIKCEWGIFSWELRCFEGTSHESLVKWFQYWCGFCMYKLMRLKELENFIRTQCMATVSRHWELACITFSAMLRLSDPAREHTP